MAAGMTEVLPRHEFSPIDVDRLERGLYDYNRQATGRDDGKKLGFIAINPHGTEIGAIAGYSWAGMAEIRQLWVDEGYRGLGIGRRLLEAAIAEALERACRYIWVLSYDFQAPGLYEKCGFDRVVELQDWPPGHSHVVLRRRLVPS